MDNSKLKIGVTSTAIALVCVGATYAYLRYKYRLRDAVEALNYLTVKTVTNEEACDEVVRELRKRTKLHRAIGFDCEWVTEQGKRQPVALIQLSTFDGLCGLFRLSHMKTVPQSLKDLLEDESVYKVGVAPFEDGTYLQHDYSVGLKSTLDIRHLAELCGYHAGGLASLSKDLLQIQLDKSWRIRCSDWGADQLTDRQTTYAAADAHVAIKIFVKLVQQYHNGVISWLSRTNYKVWENLDNLCWKYADVRFSTKHKSEKKRVTRERKEQKVEEMSKRYANSTRSKPLYHNCLLEAPDGETLCTCDTKKALWYVEKELADVVNQSPLRVRLRFEPAGRSVGDVGKYYQLTKENKCVVCGAGESYIRKNVVPREYRKYFPDIMKEHSSHDVVLLCIPCHKSSNIRDQSVRERLADLCAAPFDVVGNFRYTEDIASRKVRGAARALMQKTNKLPEDRRKHMEDILLAQYPGHDQITQELLQEAVNIQVVYENSDYECHGQKVVEYFLEHGGLLKLEELWREHFLSSMKPKYMPELWSIKHNEERLQVRLDEGRLSVEDVKLIGHTRWVSSTA